MEIYRALDISSESSSMKDDDEKGYMEGLKLVSRHPSLNFV